MSTASVFLHFLNRELLRSVGRSVPPHAFLPEIQLLAFLTPYALYSNFSNICEGEYLLGKWGWHFEDYLSRGIIRLAGERASASEYLESRREMYQFDAMRYPFYFNSNVSQIAISLIPSVVRTTSVTTQIAGSIGAWVTTHEPPSGHISQADTQLLLSVTDLVDEKMRRRTNEAMTLSFFEDVTKGSSLIEGAIGRFLSAEYIQTYTSFLHADIATGLPGLDVYEVMSTTFPLADCAILRASAH